MLEVDVLQSPLNNDSSSETLDKFGKSYENSEIKKKTWNGKTPIFFLFISLFDFLGYFLPSFIYKFFYC